MTVSALLLGPAGPYIALYLFILIAGQFYNTAMAHTLDLSARQQALNSALSLAELAAALPVIGVLNRRSAGVVSLTIAVGRLPAVILPALELLLTVVTILIALHLRAWRKSRITPLAVKESMDLLPTGICFGDAAGVPVLMNLAMERLCSDLNGESPANMAQLWQSIAAHSIPDADDGAPILRTDSGRVLRFRQRRLPSGHTEIIAADITELYEAMESLREENARLEDMRRRLIRYGEDAAEVTRQQEILAAKIAVHDDMGHVLLATKRCLEEPGSSDTAQIAELWRKTIDLFRSGIVPDREPDAAATLIDAAHDVGVEVTVEGALPGERLARNIVINALHESITNTLRHAHGDRLHLRVREAEGYWVVTFVNNGDAPDGPVRETGGLHLLRQMTESDGGVMEILTQPEFTLRLTLPKGDEL